MLNFNSATHQQAPTLQQDYAQFFLNQQSYINNLNMPVLYNNSQVFILKILTIF